MASKVQRLLGKRWGEATDPAALGHLQLLKIELHVVIGRGEAGHSVALGGEGVLGCLRRVLGIGHGASSRRHGHHALGRLLRSVEAWILHRGHGDRRALTRVG